jgi:hypothetical protein
MSRRALAVVAPLVLVALTASACRLIVGITDLSVDASVDATFDGMHADVRSGGADTSADVGEDRGSPDAASDAGADRQDVGSGPPVNCDAQPPSEASAGRVGCIQGCIDGHLGSSAEFYDEAKTCICETTNCKSACPAFCDKACLVPTPTGACNDCASHVIVDDGGGCHSFDDAGCTGCASFATCVAECPAT